MPPDYWGNAQPRPQPRARLVGRVCRKRQREREVELDTLEGYAGFPGYELLFLHKGKAYRVPPNDRRLVLHLAEALHPRAISDHLAYVEAAEAAAGAAHHWVAAVAEG